MQFQAVLTPRGGGEPAQAPPGQGVLEISFSPPVTSGVIITQGSTGQPSSDIAKFAADMLHEGWLNAIVKDLKLSESLSVSSESIAPRRLTGSVRVSKAELSDGTKVFLYHSHDEKECEFEIQPFSSIKPIIGKLDIIFLKELTSKHQSHSYPALTNAAEFKDKISRLSDRDLATLADRLMSQLVSTSKMSASQFPKSPAPDTENTGLIVEKSIELLIVHNALETRYERIKRTAMESPKAQPIYDVYAEILKASNVGKLASIFKPIICAGIKYILPKMSSGDLGDLMKYLEQDKLSDRDRQFVRSAIKLAKKFNVVCGYSEDTMSKASLCARLIKALPTGKTIPTINLTAHELFFNVAAKMAVSDVCLVGPSGGLNIGTSGTSGRSHVQLTVEREDNGNWNLSPGFRRSAWGTFIEEQGEIAGKERLLPGQRFSIQGSIFTIPHTLDDLTPPKEAYAWYKLSRGLPITLGRSETCDIRVQPDNPKVSRINTLVVPAPNGEVDIVDGEPASEPIRIFNGTGWVPVTERTVVRGGTRVRVGETELRLPNQKGRQFCTSALGLTWEMPSSPGRLLANSRTENKKATTVAWLQVYGARPQETAILRKALDEVHLSDPQLEIHVVEDLGEIVDLNGSKQIRGFSLNQGKVLLISAHILQDLTTTKALLTHLEKLKEGLNCQLRQERGLSKLAGAVAEQYSKYTGPDSEALNGRFNGDPILGRDLAVGGSTYIRGRLLTIHIPKSSDLLAETVAQVKQLFDENHTLRRTGIDREESVLEIVHRYVTERLKYDLTCDQQVLNNSGIVPQPGTLPDVSIDAYLTLGKGVCAHQAILATYIFEKLKEEGILGQTVSFSYDQNQANNSAHAWCRAELSDGQVWAIDPAGNYCGHLLGGVNWLYCRPLDVERAHTLPF